MHMCYVLKERECNAECMCCVQRGSVVCLLSVSIEGEWCECGGYLGCVMCMCCVQRGRVVCLLSVSREGEWCECGVHSESVMCMC